MRRGFRAVSLLTLFAFFALLAGCDSEGTVNPSDTSQEAAKQAVAKMPPLPTNPNKKK